MSTELINETKSIEVLRKERTWRIEMFAERNKEYSVTIHREISEKQNGVYLPVDRINLEIPRYHIGADSILSSNETVSYKDSDGFEKTFNVKDFPILISQFCDDEIERAKANGWNDGE